jgi:hypothetical protein
MGGALSKLGLNIVAIDPNILQNRAMAMTRLSDFGPGDYPEALDVLCQSLDEDVHLSLAGRIAIRDHLIRALSNRLRQVELQKSRPEIFAVPLNQPLIVAGLPRSGTTFLHRLLALHPEARAIPFFELREPIPRPGPDRRRSQARNSLGAMKRLAPQLDMKHFMDADEPEECTMLFDSCLWSGTFFRLTPVYSYLSWFLKQDPEPGYRCYRRYLQVFQSSYPKMHLTLKSPDHVGYLHTIAKVLPEARIVHTHRDPVPAITSYSSLMHTVHGVVASSLDARRSSSAGLDLWARLMEYHLANRDDIPDDRIVDISYDKIRTDPLETVRQIYRHFGWEVDGDYEARLKEHIGLRPQHKHGKHSYTLEEYGLDADEIRHRFEDYGARFLGEGS